MSYANPFAAIALIAEERITQAGQAGAFDNLPGQGRPLVFEDDSHIPEELRMAYKLLKNSDYLPENTGRSFSVSRALREEEATAETIPQSPSEHTAATMHGKLSRLSVMLARVRKQQGKSADLLDQAMLHDSPYLSHLLNKV